MSAKHYLLYGSERYALAILRPLQAAIRARGDEAAWFFDGPGGEELQPGETLLRSTDAVRDFAPHRGAHFQQRRAALLSGREDGSLPRLRRRQAAPHLHPRLLRPVLHDRRRATRARSRRRRASSATSPCTKPAGRSSIRSCACTAPTSRRRCARKPAILYHSTFSPSWSAAPILYETIRDLSRSGRWQWIVTLHPKSDRETVRTLPRARRRAPALRDRGQHPRPVPAGRHDDLGHVLGAERVPADVQAGRHVQEPPPRPAADRHRQAGAAAAVDRARAGAAAGADGRDPRATPTRSIRIATAARASACSTRSTSSSPRARAIREPKPRNWWRKLKIRRRIRYWGRA